MFLLYFLFQSLVEDKHFPTGCYGNYVDYWRAGISSGIPVHSLHLHHCHSLPSEFNSPHSSDDGFNSFLNSYLQGTIIFILFVLLSKQVPTMHMCIHGRVSN